MEPTVTSAPPVVAVMVVHEPGSWFDEVLAALAAQDYEDLRCLFLVAGAAGDLPARIRAVVPEAFVRAVAGNPGFGAAANQVLRLVDGDNGFFCFLHDDVALAPDAIRLMVEELYRSNAGIVGPKLVEWRNDALLQHVGYEVDRFGEIDPVVEPGELDQEQHDAVRDTFAVPSACMLVRADLFRTLGGFDPSIAYHGDDVDLCWRAHLGGARVMVAPAARVRHREGLRRRRPDLPHDGLATRNRLRSVATLTGGARLPLLILQLLVLTLVEALGALLTGRFRQALATLWSLLGMLPRTPAYLARRRTLAPLRRVPPAEVARLQLRGSARVRRWLRARELRQDDPDSTTERRWRQTAGSAPALAWLAVAGLVLVGSRTIITGGVPRFGEFLAFPESPRRLVGDYLSGWWGHGLGSAAAVPTGVAIISVASVGTLFHMGLLQTVAVVGLLFAGLVGIWRLASIFPTARARITMLVVYAGAPLPAQLLAGGHWRALGCYAAAPWGVHLLRRIAGMETSGYKADTAVEHYVDVPPERRRRLAAQLVLLVAASIAFVPAFSLVFAGMALLLALGTVLAGGEWRRALTLVVAAIGAGAAGFVLNLPWALSLVGSDGYTSIVGVPVTSARSLGVSTLFRFLDDQGGPAVVVLLLFLPVLVAPLVARAWRSTWAMRAAALVAGFSVLAVLDDRSLLPVRMPAPGVLLVPVAVGIALSAGCLAAAIQDDVLGGHFGWRQPLGVVTAAAAVVGLVPGLVSVADGQWGMPRRTMVSVLAQLPTNPVEGDYRVLWIGDPQVLPVSSYTYQPGIGYAITDDGPLSLEGHWAGRPTDVETEVADALRSMAYGETVRGGRLLAPYGIRYVIVPLADGANGTIDAPIDPPLGLVEVLDDQLDLAAPLTRPPNYVIFENTAYTPTRSILSPEGAEASRQAGAAALAQADLSGSVPFALGAADRGDAVGVVPAGTLHVAVPFDPRWELTVDGRPVESRNAFGSTMAFDIATGGEARLHYDTPIARRLVVLVQFVAWAVVLLLASRIRPADWWRRRRAAMLDDESTVVDLRPAMRQPVDTGLIDDWTGAVRRAAAPAAPDPWVDTRDLDGAQDDAWVDDREGFR